ncbi:MAG: ABC transporter ATP-binding protein [Deltaproteobacteria bacterium]|nr:ABC transporter ATP-binding protein [Deltaproteobacteria bacterium]
MSIELVDISKTYFNVSNKEEIKAVNDISFNVEDGEFVSIIGPSGCGKTTLLRIISGLEQPSTGKIFLRGKEIERPYGQVGLIFQEYALFPWRTVIDNIDFGLEIKKVPKKKRKEMARFYLNKFNLDGFENKYPKELSGGMKQRVAIARTLINDPELLLMDEPFGSLDSQTRNSMQEFLLKVWQETKKTILFVSHNIDETVFLSQKVFGLSARPGRIKLLLEIDLPYPRERTSQEFNLYRKKILDYLEQERIKSDN